MGPSTFIDGDWYASSSSVVSTYHPLQWGRRRSSTETARRARSPPTPRRFNGAVDVHRRRPGTRRWGSTLVYQLQWGRRRSSTETKLELCLDTAGVEASMGPSTFIDGDSHPLHQKQ